MREVNPLTAVNATVRCLFTIGPLFLLGLVDFLFVRGWRDPWR